MNKYNDKEIRMCNGVEFREILEDGQPPKMVLEGYALKFNNETLIGSEDYGFREIIDARALDNADMRKVPLKYNHTEGYLALASTRNGSLKLAADQVGLKFEAELINTQSNRDIYESVKAGLLGECSFAFILDEKGSDWDFSEKTPLRTIKNIKRLYDIALVDIPAYDQTTVSARTFDLFENELKAAEVEKSRVQRLKIAMEMKIKLGGISNVKKNG